jgi:hypothetical protein
MTPSSFSFKLTVPGDPGAADIVAGVAAHAAEYANLEGAAASLFVDRVRAAVGKALNSGGSASCLAVFAAVDGHLTMTLGSETVSQPLA